MPGVAVGESELLRVRLRGKNRYETRRVLDAVVGAYLSEIANTQRLRQVTMLDSLRKRYQTVYENIKSKSDAVDKLKSQLGQVGDSEQKRRLSQLDRLHSRQIHLELKAIEVNELAIDAEQKVIEAQLKHIQNAFDNELTGFRELNGTSGETTVRDVEIDILQEELRAVRAEIHKIELRVQAPDPIQVIQSATFR